MTDPLRPTTDLGRELFAAFTKLASGKSYDDVLDASFALILNTIRQQIPTRREADVRFDELVHRAKTLLLDQHYDSVTGKRRSVFPFTQVIDMPRHEEPF